ncbi:MAG: NAD-dependent epimerase/dehydratase family protein [Deltaproteobacteria bacterium]|nr:NAD-dependent epimerase/dehydratase family protein [Deltaproteobacteria bacterium]
MKNKENKPNKKPQVVLVTGGGGFLGGAIVRRLVERGDHVRSFSRSSYAELTAMGVEQIQGDIREHAVVEKACKGVKLVFHVAAKPGVWGKYDDFYKTNVTGTRNVIEGCNRHNIPRLVYTSSPSVVFDGTDMEGVDESAPYPDTYHAHYPKTKAMAEQLVVKAASRQLKTITLRPHLIWGPRDNHLVPRIIERANRLKRIGEGQNLVDTIYIDNAAQAHILAADCLESNPDLSGNIYFISQGEPVLVWDMVNDILNAAGLPPVKRSIPHRIAWIIGAVLEFVYNALHLKEEPQMTRFLADELATAHWFDIRAAQKDLGYVPEISTKEGLRRLEAWLKNNV